MSVSDTELLRRYVREKAEDAFAELVHRYFDLVYCAAASQGGRAPAPLTKTKAGHRR